MRRSTTTGRRLGSKLTKKIPQGWFEARRAQLLDLFDLDGGFRVQAQFFGLVVEGQLVEVLGGNWPVELIAQIFNQRRKALDGAETFNVQDTYQYSFSPARSALDCGREAAALTLRCEQQFLKEESKL